MIEFDPINGQQMEMHHLFTERRLVKQQSIDMESIESILISWLNKNIGKQKNGTFVPLCVLKWCLVDQE